MRYIVDDELVYEVILSKGIGKPTNRLQEMMVKIANRVAYKMTYNCQDDMNDCISNAILKMFENWMRFNEKKYEFAIPYFTEIAKRGLADGFNIINNMKEYRKCNMKFVSLTDKSTKYI